MAMPRPSRAGSGLSQSAIAATRSSAVLKRRSVISSRRNWNGSFFAACAISSMNDSLKKPCCELSTERHGPVRIGCLASRAENFLSAIAYGMNTDSPSPPPA